jgi:hypothetical protein
MTLAATVARSGLRAARLAARALLVLLAGVAAARADVIDGEWCRATSHFIIDGPQIRTPGGQTVEGNYSRHAFRYRVPAPEEGAGSEITMLLLNEETLQLSRPWVAEPPEIWKRCKPTS